VASLAILNVQFMVGQQLQAPLSMLHSEPTSNVYSGDSGRLFRLIPDIGSGLIPEALDGGAADCFV
jgi:hypothetical protein